MEKPWIVYIVKCQDDSYYTGITNDLAKRIKKHNDGKGAKYTKSRRPVVLMYAKPLGSQGDALREELRIKSLNRASKELLFA